MSNELKGEAVQRLLTYLKPVLKESLDHYLFEDNTTYEAEYVWDQCHALDEQIALGRVVSYTVTRLPDDSLYFDIIRKMQYVSFTTTVDHTYLGNAFSDL